ncbi:MAG: AraC family transcriptional regulator [Chthoniobacterales bacterium]
MKSPHSWENLLPQLRIEFGSAMLYHCAADWSSEYRLTTDEQLHLIHKGTLEYRIEDRVYKVEAGQIAFCPPGVEWSVIRTSKTLISLTVIHFQARFPGGQRYLEAFGFPEILKPQEKDWKHLLLLARQMCDTDARKPSGYMLKVSAMLYEFFSTFFHLRGPAMPVDRDGERVLKLINYMKEHYRERITLASLSKLVFVSSNHLSTIFREYTGRSPIDYLIQLRMEEASRLLQSPQYAIGEIGTMVGYEDAAYFSRHFRKHFGMPPADFRRNRRSII